MDYRPTELDLMILFYTMCKFQDFSITHILREINFMHSRSAKTAIFAIKKGSEFCSFGKFQPSKSAKIHKSKNSEPLDVVKWLILHFKNSQN